MRPAPRASRLRRMVTIMYPALAVLLGALVYGLSANGKVGQLGLYTFASGMLVLVYMLASKTVHF